LVCLDEFAKQLLSETRLPIPATSRHPARHDYEYVREGSISGFILALPHLGARDLFVGEDGRRTAKDFAACLDYCPGLFRKPRRSPGDGQPHPPKEASLYEAFPPEKARGLCERFEFHYTPKHGSWLNMAEIEIGLLVRGCLDRRIGSAKEFRREIAAYLDRKNENPKPINWQFANKKARVKLKSLNPAV
jgi:hypothetical protein